MVTTIIGIFVIGALLIGPIMSNVEKPPYQIVTSKDNIEIRQYKPMIIAEVEVEGKREEAIKKGFRLLAGYIFGKNTVKEDIAMTRPVKQKKGEKIAMTSPVKQQLKNNAWKISFVMPSEYSMKTLPKPMDMRVKLIEVAAKQFVVIRYSGFGSDKNIAKNEAKLIKYVKSNNILTTGLPTYAFYDAPWTLPLMRHNEVMIEIR